MLIPYAPIMSPDEPAEASLDVGLELKLQRGASGGRVVDAQLIMMT